MGKKEALAGSWFNSGYHGHYRSKSRSDFLCEYRHLARPPPPKTFIRRCKEPAARHIFSRHDNRHSFMNDALYFEEGLGRKRLANDTQTTKADLLTWMPQKEELDRAPPKNSVYKVDYRGIPFQPLEQQLVKRPKTSFDGERMVTSYGYAHGRENPNRIVLDAMSNAGLQGTITKPKQKALRATNDTVASCLSWYVPHEPKACTLPAATQTLPSAPQTSQITEVQSVPLPASSE